jgi:HEAT repeat protein
MECFYEVSRLTQQRFGSQAWGVQTASLGRGKDEDAGVKVIQVKTVGAYEVTVLSATNAAALGEWLQAHRFAFPKEKQEVLDGYIKKQWYFVAAKINPNENGFVIARGLPKTGPDSTAISPSIRKELANGELHPLVISFPSEKCVFPLAISAVNGKPSEVSLYVLSSEPLTSRVIFDKKFAAYSRERTDWIQQAGERQKKREEMIKQRDERLKNLQQVLRARTNGPGSSLGDGTSPLATRDNDPADPQPDLAVMRQLLGLEEPFMRIRAEAADEFSGMGDSVQSMEVGSKDLVACSKEIPRLAGKSWWLSKEVQVFGPLEMRDLEFEPAVPILAEKLRTADGPGAAICLSQLGVCAVPVVLAAAKSSNPVERRMAAMALQGMAQEDPRLAAALPGLLADADARIRRDGCYAALEHWDAALAHRVAELLSDPDLEVRKAACSCLINHPDRSQIPLYRKLVEEDGLAAPQAIGLLNRENLLSREQLVHVFSSTNLPVVSTAFTRLRSQNLELKEIEPLLTNSLVMARMMGLGALTQIGNKEAVDRMVAMLRDPNEGVRWHVRARLRHLTGQKLGPDPAAYEKWWAENKNYFKPPPPSTPGPPRR